MQAGDHVGTQVELERPLAEGGMGTLWVGRHIALETQVAVKFLSPEFATNEEAVARFRREAATAAKVRSPHIVQQLDHGIAPDGAPFIVMELLSGDDLAKLLKKNGGRLRSALVLQLIQQTCRALTAAHEAAVVHRDIKPANIFVIDNSGDPFVKLLDFGIARDPDFRTNGLTQTDVLMGTAPYMSPEQLFDTSLVDERTDLWAIAVVTYQCLTGRLPFGEDALPSISLAVGRREYEPPTSVVVEMPPALDAWFARAFAEELTDRFQNARELSDSLASALELGSPSSAMAIPLRESASLSPLRMAMAPTVPAPAFGSTQVSPERPKAGSGWPLPGWILGLIAAVSTIFALGVFLLYLRSHVVADDADGAGGSRATRVVSRVAKRPVVFSEHPLSTSSPKATAGGTAGGTGVGTASTAVGTSGRNAGGAAPGTGPRTGPGSAAATPTGTAAVAATSTTAATATTRTTNTSRPGPASVAF